MSFVAQSLGSEFEQVVQFFQGLLRPDSDCQLREEFPLVFDEEACSVIFLDPKSDNYLSGAFESSFDSGKLSHLVVFKEGETMKGGLAVMIRAVEVQPGSFSKMAFVGSVVTDPTYRNQGVQRDLFKALDNACASADIDLILLWSNQVNFYQKLGFYLGGLQATWGTDMRLALNSGVSIQAEFVGSSEFKMFDAHFEAFRSKKLCVSRSKDEMESLFKIPDMKIAYTKNAYALLGKGEDFKGICHEWAGPSAEVLSCLARLQKEEPNLRILSPGIIHNQDELEVARSLEQHSFDSRLEYLGLMKNVSGRFTMDDFNPEKLRYPFFIWGLDSI